MLMRHAIFMVFVGIFVIGTSVPWAGTEDFDKAMYPVLEEYLKIHEALAADKTDGIRGAAERIVTLAGSLDAGSVTGEHQAHYKDVPQKIKKAAKDLSKGGDIEQMREAFKGLSRPMAMWGTMSKPKGVYVVYCSMAEGSWLQKDKEIRNPYHGLEMLRCGEIVDGG